MLTEAKPRIVYEIIETLLPQAAYSETNNKGDRLLELYDNICTCICACVKNFPQNIIIILLINFYFIIFFV